MNHDHVTTLQKLMINENLNTVSKLQGALIIAEAALSSLPKDTPYQSFEMRLVSSLFISFS